MKGKKLFLSGFFYASHQLRLPGGRKEPLHRHRFKIEAVVERGRDSFPLPELIRAFEESIRPFDEANVNEIPEFKEELNPSTENMAYYLFGRLERLLPKNCHLRKVTLWETEDSAASYIVVGVL
ncbi:MAG: 6-carboxytetrahydropterin synthase [Acidobacteria bacterium]|nr:6-carboxytetrahydropterin synthase [Acidobacteriota bacterium]